MERHHLTRFAWLSVGTAVATIGLKIAAYYLTGSVGLLSDALESGVNLVAALLALFSLTIAALPPDEEHAHGHDKAEYFSSGAEGTLIVIAAITIAITAAQRLLNPQPLEQVGLGLVASLVASACNWAVARILWKAGKANNSVTLMADSQHLMTDVWTSAGVLVGITAVALTGWVWLDPLIAIAVAVQITVAGVRLVRQAINGLMDPVLPGEEVAQIEAILKKYAARKVQYHALRTRQAGARRFITVHIQVPGAWSVQEGHVLLEEIEAELRQAFTAVAILTHLEPAEDPASWEDIAL